MNEIQSENKIQILPGPLLKIILGNGARAEWGGKVASELIKRKPRKTGRPLYIL